MFRNTFQSGFLSILYSIGSKPLQIWDKKGRCFFISFLHLSSQHFFPHKHSFRHFDHLPSTKWTITDVTRSAQRWVALCHCFNAPTGRVWCHPGRARPSCAPFFINGKGQPTDGPHNCIEKEKCHESKQRPTVHTRV